MPKRPSTDAQKPLRPQTLDRYRRILARFDKLADERIGGVKKYNHMAIYEMMATEFFLASVTIRTIVREAKKLRDQGQL